MLIEETPEFLEDKLKELDDELARTAWNKDAYLLAEAEDKEFARYMSRCSNHDLFCFFQEDPGISDLEVSPPPIS
jgi:hypothetical protein